MKAQPLSCFIALLLGTNCGRDALPGAQPGADVFITPSVAHRIGCHRYGRDVGSRMTSERPSRGRADLPRLRVVRDAEIARTSPPELSDLPEAFWRDAEVVTPVPKQAISLRVDEDVLAWFLSQGPRYQSRMNAVLRSFMEHSGASRTRSRRSTSA